MLTNLRSIGTRSFNLLNPLPLLLQYPWVYWVDPSANFAKEGLGFDSGRAISSERGTMRAWRMSGGRAIGGKVMSSCRFTSVTRVKKEWGNSTSKDWAYQSLTFWMEGMALRLWGSSSSSLTRWARRTGSSSTILLDPNAMTSDRDHTCQELARFQKRSLARILAK